MNRTGKGSVVALRVVSRRTLLGAGLQVAGVAAAAAALGETTGVATFTTVVPGWYRGRTTHVHFEIPVDGGEVLTSQGFLPEAVLSDVYATGVHAARGDEDTTDDDDGIFQEADDDAVLFAEGDAAAGFTASLTVDVSA